MLFETGDHGTAVLVPHLFDFAGVVLVFKPTVISLLLAFMLVSACVALFVYIGADASAEWGLTNPVGIGVGVCFGVGVGASSCACVGIDVAIGVVVGVDVS